MNIIAIILYTILSLLGILYIQKYRRVNPIFWFIILQWLLAIGTFIIVDFNIISHIVYVYIYFLSTIFFIFGVVFYWSSSKIKVAYLSFWTNNIVNDKISVRLMITILTIFSIIITVIYYKAIGMNFLVSIISGNIIEDYTTSRLSTYSGDNYYYPGYVNQFKNVLLPISILALLAWSWYNRSKFIFLVILSFGTPFLLYALLGTGQRAFLVYAYLASFFGLSAITKIPNTVKYIMGIIVLSLFSVFTYYYKSLVDSSSSIYYSVGMEIINRIFYYQQVGGLIGFQYIYNIETTWFYEWLQDLSGLLPGIKGSGLSHKIHKILYGTSRGTVPLSFVGSLYHNGGFVAVPLFSFITGMVYSLFYHRFLLGKRTVLRCIAYGALFFYLILLPLGSPIAIINNGVLTVMVVLTLRKIRYSFN